MEIRGPSDGVPATWVRGSHRRTSRDSCLSGFNRQVVKITFFALNIYDPTNVSRIIFLCCQNESLGRAVLAKEERGAASVVQEKPAQGFGSMGSQAVLASYVGGQSIKFTEPNNFYRVQSPLSSLSFLHLQQVSHRLHALETFAFCLWWPSLNCILVCVMSVCMYLMWVIQVQVAYHHHNR